MSERASEKLRVCVERGGGGARDTIIEHLSTWGLPRVIGSIDSRGGVS